MWLGTERENVSELHPHPPPTSSATPCTRAGYGGMGKTEERIDRWQGEWARCMEDKKTHLDACRVAARFWVEIAALAMVRVAVHDGDDQVTLEVLEEVRSADPY